MKTWNTPTNLMTLSLGALLASACSGVDATTSDVAGLESLEPDAAELDATHDALNACDDHQYDHWRHIAALGVAAGNELGRWNATEDFVFNGTLQLSPTGLARCKNGCANIQAILSLQSSSSSVIPRHDPNLLKGKLSTFYERQRVWNQGNGGSIPHELTPTSITTDVCGYRYSFKTSQKRLGGTTTVRSVFSNKCVDTTGNADSTNAIQYSCNGGSDQSVQVEPLGTGYRLKNVASGKCFRSTGMASGALIDQRPCGNGNDFIFDLTDVGGKYTIKSRSSGLCLDVPGFSSADNLKLQQWTCTNNNNQQWMMTLSPTTTPLNAVDQGKMVNMLNWVGNGENPYIMFKSTPTEVSIDPMGTMVDGGATAQGGACIESSTVFDTTKTMNNKCCQVDKRYGKFSATAWNTSLFFCKL